MKTASLVGVGLGMAVLFWAAHCQVCTAQVQSAGPGGVDPTLIKLLAKVPAFSAKAEVRVVDSEQNELVVTPMSFAKSRDRIRVEVDVTQARGRNVFMPDAARVRELGLDRVVSITRPDKRQMYLVYPGRRAYVSVEMSKEEIEAGERARVDTTRLGMELLDGHRCVKNRVVVTDPAGRGREVLVWNALELNEFPLLIQTAGGNATVQVRFSDVRLAKPDPKLFEPPTGYKKFPDLQKLVEAKDTAPAGGKSAK